MDFTLQSGLVRSGPFTAVSACGAGIIALGKLRCGAQWADSRFFEEGSAATLGACNAEFIGKLGDRAIKIRSAQWAHGTKNTGALGFAPPLLRDKPKREASDIEHPISSIHDE